MSMSRTLALLAAIFIVVVETLPIDADAVTLSLVGSSTKVCQFTGETDWATNQPTAAQTFRISDWTPLISASPSTAARARFISCWRRLAERAPT